MIKFQESSVINRPVETVFTYATDPEKSHLKLATPVFAPLAQRTLRRDLENLKKVMEA